jgi:hypothetical protein
MISALFIAKVDDIDQTVKVSKLRRKRNVRFGYGLLGIPNQPSTQLKGKLSLLDLITDTVNKSSCFIRVESDLLWPNFIS